MNESDEPNGSAEKLRRVFDREEIKEVVTRYAYAIDVRDWKAYRSCFAAEIEMDFSASIGSGGLKTWRADDWVDTAKQFFERLPATQHLAVSQNIRFDDGDAAICISSLHAQHYLPNDKGGSVQKMIGRYENHLTRTADGWKIKKIIQTVLWNEGNWHIFAYASGKED